MKKKIQQNQWVQRVRLVNNNNMVTHNKLNIYCYYVLQNNAQFVCEQTDPHTTQSAKNGCMACIQRTEI